MIKKVTIRNYKCYGDNPVEIKLASINFIYGDNSVGKSTFLQCLSEIYKVYEKKKSLSQEEPVSTTNEWDKFSHKGVGADKIEVAINIGDKEEWKFSSKNGKMALRNKMGKIVSHEAFNKVFPWLKHNKAHRNERSDEDYSSLQDFFDGDNLFDPKPITQMFSKMKMDYECIDSTTLRDVTFNFEVPVTSVGTGMAHLFDIFKSLEKWKKGILLLEEPETNVNENHLQTLVSLLVDEAKKRIDAGGQLFIECHSEHVLLALMRLVADKQINASDVGVFYVRKTSEGTIIESCSIDENGDLDRWDDPKGFFTAREKILFG